MDRIDLLVGNEVPVIVLENFWSEEETQLIWEELELFTYPDKLLPPETTGTATEDGQALKSNRALFLDDIWADKRHLSNILKVNRKIFDDGMKVLKESPSWFFKLCRCERDVTLLSYYENNDYYKPHSDVCTITVLHWFYKEPKRFTGGDLVLHHNDTQHKIELGNNKTVIFPSWLLHEITQIQMEEQYQNQKLGRYCMTQFLHVS